MIPGGRTCECFTHAETRIPVTENFHDATVDSGQDHRSTPTQVIVELECVSRITAESLTSAVEVFFGREGACRTAGEFVH